MMDEAFTLTREKMREIILNIWKDMYGESSEDVSQEQTDPFFDDE